MSKQTPVKTGCLFIRKIVSLIKTQKHLFRAENTLSEITNYKQQRQKKVKNHVQATIQTYIKLNNNALHTKNKH